MRWPKRTPGQFATSGTSLAFLIRWAYDLDEDRLVSSGKPLEAQFDIRAKIPPGELGPGALRLMMRSLLADRFRLIDKDGPHLHFLNTAATPNQNPFRMSDPGRIIGTRVAADMLAKALSEQLHWPVEDLTRANLP